MGALGCDQTWIGRFPIDKLRSEPLAHVCKGWMWTRTRRENRPSTTVVSGCSEGLLDSGNLIEGKMGSDCGRIMRVLGPIDGDSTAIGATSKVELASQIVLWPFVNGTLHG